MSEKNIEQQTAETILQQPVDIKVGDKTYHAAPPSVATLILVSETVSRLPPIKLNEEHVIEESLSVAKDCALLGDIVAILILGAKNLKKTVERKETRYIPYLFGLLKRPVQVTVREEVDMKAKLAKELLENVTPTDLFVQCANLLRTMQIQDFFAFTTFLTEINLLRQTKVG